MRFSRALLVAFIGAALAAYVVDCSGMTTPDEAMKCYQSMPCSSSGHGQECCKTMPQMRAPFVQSPSAHELSFAADVIAVISIFQESPRSDSAAWDTVPSHFAPPGTSPPIATPIRI